MVVVVVCVCVCVWLCDRYRVCVFILYVYRGEGMCYVYVCMRVYVCDKGNYIKNPYLLLRAAMCKLKENGIILRETKI